MTLLVAATIATSTLFAQNVGINTTNPQAVLHIDGNKDNPATGTPTIIQAINDVVVTNSGNAGIGTIKPLFNLSVVKDSFPSIHVGSTSRHGGALFLGNVNHGLIRGDSTKAALGFTPYINDVTLFTASGNYPLSGNIHLATATELGTIVPRLTINRFGNIGIGNTTPKAKLQVTGGDVYVDQIASGIIMKSPNGTCFRVTVTDSGTFTSQAIPCP